MLETESAQEELIEESVDVPSEDIVAEGGLEDRPDDSGEKEFVDSFQTLSVIESLLFISDKPVSLSLLKSAFHGTNVDTTTIKKALVELEVMYADPTRGVSLEEVNGGWQLRTKLDNFPFLKKINKTRPFKLSGPALEVLAILAYKQPLIKNEVDQIRGVESGHLVRALMDKGLVSFQGKTELPGKPMSYGTTRKFLEIFGLRNLKELPSLEEIDQLLPDGIGEEEDVETLSDVTSGMSEDYGGNYSEGEEELLQITDKLGAIDTSSDFFEEEKIRQREKRDRDRAEDIREALAVNEDVEPKNVKWLERYEAKLALEAEAKSVESDASIDAISENLEGASEVVTEEITAESVVDAEVAEDDTPCEIDELAAMADAVLNSVDSTPNDGDAEA